MQKRLRRIIPLAQQLSGLVMLWLLVAGAWAAAHSVFEPPGPPSWNVPTIHSAGVAEPRSDTTLSVDSADRLAFLDGYSPTLTMVANHRRRPGSASLIRPSFAAQATSSHGGSASSGEKAGPVLLGRRADNPQPSGRQVQPSQGGTGTATSPATPKPKKRSGELRIAIPSRYPTPKPSSPTPKVSTPHYPTPSAAIPTVTTPTLAPTAAPAASDYELPSATPPSSPTPIFLVPSPVFDDPSPVFDDPSPVFDDPSPPLEFPL